MKSSHLRLLLVCSKGKNRIYSQTLHQQHHRVLLWCTNTICSHLAVVIKSDKFISLKCIKMARLQTAKINCNKRSSCKSKQSPALSVWMLTLTPRWNDCSQEAHFWAIILKLITSSPVLMLSAEDKIEMSVMFQAAQSRTLYLSGN